MFNPEKCYVNRQWESFFSKIVELKQFYKAIKNGV